MLGKAESSSQHTNFQPPFPFREKAPDQAVSLLVRFAKTLYDPSNNFLQANVTPAAPAYCTQGH
jgi:hypothetical protein